MEHGRYVGYVNAVEGIDLGTGSYLQLARGFIPPDQATTMMRDLERELAWEERAIVLFGKRLLQPRLVAWAGAVPYRYSGQTLPPRELTPTVATLLERVSDQVSPPTGKPRFNHVLANRYRDGNDSMGMHADAEPELGADPVVATLSFGATRGLAIQPRKGLQGERRTILLGQGDLLIMGGACQRYFRHGIPRARRPVGPRISLTFRYIE